MREGNRKIPQARNYMGGTTGRQSPDVAKLLTLLKIDDPIFGRVALRLPKLKQYGVELTDDILANVIATVREEAAAEDRRKGRDPQVGSELVTTSKGRTEKRESVVYYMQLGNRVKIGTSFNLPKRVQQISPEKVLATEPGGTVTERQRHKQFAELRVVGEWFRLEGTLVEHINELRKAWKP